MDTSYGLNYVLVRDTATAPHLELDWEGLWAASKDTIEGLTDL